MGKARTPGHLFKKKTNHLIVAWANRISWGKNGAWLKKLKSSQRGDLRNETVVGDFENLQHTSGDVEGCTHMRSCEGLCAYPGEIQESLNFSPWAIFEVMLKQEMKAKIEL